MGNDILVLEKSLFKYEYMSNREWLENVIHDNFVECGKSGRLFDKSETIDMLHSCKSDRKIEIYNYECKRIDDNTYLIHYITKSDDKLIYRTSIWVMEERLKILFHQASSLASLIELVRA